jgi:hypothetical protein
MNKKAQITIFIILAIVIVVGALVLIVFRESIFGRTGSQEFSEVYFKFDECIELRTTQGLQIAGSQAGYVDVPGFESGSSYAPFSSQLDFLGIPVPYWYYVSGNGVIKEQVPTLSLIEAQLEDFIKSEISTCDFSEFRAQGYVVDYDVSNVDVKIENSKVNVRVNSDFLVQKDDLRSRKTLHEINFDNNFGKMYDFAKEFYNKEKQEAFIENYSLDVLFNYAPVVGSEISCAPEIWNPQEVVENLRDALSANIGALKVQGDYYSLDDKTEEYFVIDVKSDFDVNFLYDKNWPTRIEVWPVENNLMIAEPVGLQQGLGILGFCYVPYNFVYDIYHPVLVQVYDGDVLFQFPLAIVIDKNNPRNSLIVRDFVQESELSEFCNYKNTLVNVQTYDTDFNPVEADVSFKCLNENCYIGKTSLESGDAVLSENFPQCVGGIVSARAEGYVTGEEIISTNSGKSVELILDKLYELNLDLRVGGSTISSDSFAVIQFEGERHKTTIAYPQQKTIQLSEDLYNVSVQIFSTSGLTIPQSNTRQCVDVPKDGLINSLLRRTEEKCFEIEIPSQEISQALSAGGKNIFFLFERDLKLSNSLIIDTKSLPSPSSLDQLQQNYELIETNYLEVDLR